MNAVGVRARPGAQKKTTNTKYPSRLQMYTSCETPEISIEDFETYALDRLQGSPSLLLPFLSTQGSCNGAATVIDWRYNKGKNLVLSSPKSVAVRASLSLFVAACDSS